MDRYTVLFIKASLIYLLLGIIMGIILTLKPFFAILSIFALVHNHLNLFGFMAMMIFGVSYHIIPRFSGKPIYSYKLMRLHFYLANIGLVGLLLGFIASSLVDIMIHKVVLIVSGSIAAISVYIYVYNIWRSMSTLKEAVVPKR